MADIKKIIEDAGVKIHILDERTDKSHDFHYEGGIV